MTQVVTDLPSTNVHATDHSVRTVPFALKAVAFVGAVISLSWFFEGWRQINQSPTFAHFGILVLAITSTWICLVLMGYWMYFEEQSRGTLKKRIVIFDRIHDALQKGALRKQGETKHHE